MQNGTEINHLTFIEKVGANKHRHALAKFICDCGNEHVAILSNVKNGKTSSCGCYKKKYLSENSPAVKHGLCKGGTSNLYYVWRGMKKRCYRPKTAGYENYGGRGINVCDEWKNSFPSFYSWAMKNGYNEGLQIDRRKNNGDYTPKNCRWVTPLVNSNNKRNNVYVELNCERKTVSEWAHSVNADTELFRARLKRYGNNLKATLSFFEYNC